jgi:hypothetical protein
MIEVLAFATAFALLLVGLAKFNAWSDKGFLAAGGTCLWCRDTGSPGPLHVHCPHCGTTQKGYE